MSSSSGSVRVLIVDDDFKVAGIHREFVGLLRGFEVIGEAYTAASAQAMVESQRPDLILLDMYLPDASGLDVMRHLARGAPTPPDVIAVTAAKDVQTLQAAVRLGALQYVVKPFTISLLHEKLTNYLAWRQLSGRAAVPDQHTVDRLVGSLRAGTESKAVPKGLAEETLNMIEQVLRTSGQEMSAEDVAAEAGVSRVTARRYLDYLRKMDRIQMRSRYGSSGRPQHLYTSRSMSDPSNRP